MRQMALRILFVDEHRFSALVRSVGHSCYGYSGSNGSPVLAMIMADI